jgi:CrcB protein
VPPHVPAPDRRVDPDVDLHVAGDRQELRVHPWLMLALIACGGVFGTLTRYGLQQAWPHQPGQFPWATFVVNVSGCLLIGVLMTLIGHLWPNQRLLRPFLGVGFLGGYTTFSTYALDIQQALGATAAATALLYLAGTLVTALLAVWAGTTITTAAVQAIQGRAYQLEDAAAGHQDRR